MGLRRRSLGACCLCLALLLWVPSWVSAQASKQEGSSTASSSKRSSIIPSAGETDLVNGIMDVKPDGRTQGVVLLGGAAATHRQAVGRAVAEGLELLHPQEPARRT